MLLALPNIDIIGRALGQDGATIGIAIAVALTLDLSLNVSFNPTRSVIADVTPEGEKRTKGYAWMQTVSGTFGVLAYFIGASLGNHALIYLGAFLVFVFSIVPPLFITEPRFLNQADESSSQEQAPISLKEILVSLLPLYGYLIYGVYVIIAQLAHLKAEGNIIEYFCIGLTFLIGAYILFTAAKEDKDETEFQKILLAHSFTWWGIQTMFIYTFFFVKDKMGNQADDGLLNALLSILPIEISDPSDVSGVIVNITFLLLNLVGALLPALLLQPMANKIGKVKVHMLSIALMAAGYFLIYYRAASPTLLFIFILVVGIGWASTISLSFAIMSERVNQAKMGLYMGVFNLSVVLPQLVASFKMGEIVNNQPDKSIVFLISTLTLAISAVLWLFVKESQKGRAVTVSGGSGGH